MKRQDIRNRTPHFKFATGEGFRPGEADYRADHRIMWAFVAGMGWATILFMLGLAFWPAQ